MDEGGGEMEGQVRVGYHPPFQSGKDLSRLVEWKDVECFTGNQYKKFYRAPENYCFSLVVRFVYLWVCCMCACAHVCM